MENLIIVIPMVFYTGLFWFYLFPKWLIDAGILFIGRLHNFDFETGEFEAGTFWGMVVKDKTSVTKLNRIAYITWAIRFLGKWHLIPAPKWIHRINSWIKNRGNK